MIAAKFLWDRSSGAAFSIQKNSRSAAVFCGGCSGLFMQAAECWGASALPSVPVTSLRPGGRVRGSCAPQRAPPSRWAALSLLCSLQARKTGQAGAPAHPRAAGTCQNGRGFRPARPHAQFSASSPSSLFMALTPRMYTALAARLVSGIVTRIAMLPMTACSTSVTIISRLSSPSTEAE